MAGHVVPRRSLLPALLLLLLCGCGPQLTMLSPAVAGSAQAEVPSVTGEGVASWYGPGFAGRRTANGEIFDPNQLTAAHKTLPFDTQLRVTNLANGRSVEVRINDRGPFKGTRIIDLSRAAAERIGMIGTGTARVRIETLNAEPGTLPAAADASLARYDIVALGRRPGELLLLSSASAGPVLVRVVGGNIPPESGAQVLLSGRLLGELGATVSIHAPP